MRSVRNLRPKDQWLYHQSFNSKRMEQESADNQKGTPEIKFGKPESFTWNTLPLLDSEVLD